MSAINFWKYHASGNDFLVVISTARSIGRTYWRKTARTICDRNRGIGADGLLVLSRTSRTVPKLDIFNADGSWAEKSGNGLRIAGLHMHLMSKSRRNFTFETANGPNEVMIREHNSRGWKISCELGRPEFLSREVPVRTRKKYFINHQVKIDGVSFSITCLSTGNPHAVMFVDHLEFDWKALGAKLEIHKMFPNRTNVEFVRIIDRKHVVVAEWERGVGATGSSGTGAAATVATGVINGFLDRRCKVTFSDGDLDINWRKVDDIIELNGYVNRIGEGSFEYR